MYSSESVLGMAHIAAICLGVGVKESKQIDAIWDAVKNRKLGTYGRPSDIVEHIRGIARTYGYIKE